MFLVNQAFSENVIEFEYVGKSALQQRRRRLQTNDSKESQKIQTVLEKVQAQISNLQLRDQEIYGLHEKVDWTDGHWRKCSLLAQRKAD